MRKDAGIRTTVIATLSALAVAVPAVAAPRDPFATSARSVVVPEVLVDEAAADARPTGPMPPFHPLIGRPDYGDSEARFGAARTGHIHAGQDVFAEPGTPLVSPTFGVVIERGTDGARGNHLGIYDARRDRTYVYMHMIEPASVQLGDHVKPGERVGSVGCTGSCWGDHVHFEIRKGRDVMGEAIDPLPFLRDWEQLKNPR